MASNKDYRLILKASIDATSLQEEVDTLSKKYSLNLKLNINDKDVSDFTAKVNSSINKSKSKIQLIDAKMELKSLDEIQTRIKELQDLGKNVQTTNITNNTGDVTGQIVKYRDAQDTLITETYKLKNATDEQNAGFVQTTKVVQGSTKSIATWTDGLSNAISRTLQYATSIGLVYGALNQIKQGIQYVKDLNKEMTNIQVLQVTGAQTPEEVNALALSYNRLARELGATTIEVAQGSVEWLRQGKSIAETQELLRSSLMLSKLGNLETADATNYLTATLNSYKLEAKDASSVVDKLIAVDNVAATSAGELATALQYSAASGQQAGVSLDKLISYIGVVSSVTRQSAETIGQSFKTMFARMQDIKAGKIDEDGLGLNNVESALARIDVPLRDSQHQFRNMSDVLEDVSAKWNGLSDTEQANIAKSIAGVRQANIFYVLMGHMNEALKLQTEESNSAGLAMDRYSIYLKSAEAAQNRFIASWEKLIQGTVSSGLVPALYDIGSGLLNIISLAGGLPALFGVITTSLLAFNGAAIVSAVGITTLTDAWAALTLIMEANPFGFAVLAIGAAVLAFNYFNDTVDETRDKLNQLSMNAKESAANLSKLNKQSDSIKDLWKEFESLKNKTSKTNDEQERFFKVQSDLRDILPTVSGYYDEQGNFIIDETVNLKALLDLKKEEIDIEKEKLSLANKKSYEADINAYKKTRQEIEQFQRQANSLIITPYAAKGLAEKLKEDALLQKEYMNQIKTSYYSLDKAQQDVLLNTLKNGDKIDQEIAKQLATVVNTVKQASSQISSSSDSPISQVTKESKDAFKALTKNVVEMLKDIKKQEKDNLKQELSDYKNVIEQRKKEYKDQLDRQKQIYDDEKTSLQRQKEDEQQNADDRKQAIKDELDSYLKIISAQEELLKAKKAEDDYNNKTEENQKKLSDLEAQIIVLGLDDSAEAQAKKLQLEDEAAKLQKGMSQDVADRQYNLQNQALEHEKQIAQETSQLQTDSIDQEKKNYEESYSLRLREIDDEQQAAQRRYDIRVEELDNSYNAKEKSLQDQIQLIDDYLSKEGNINKQALDLIADKNSSVYKDLIAWNSEYGTGIDKDIVQMWDSARMAVEQYRTSLAGLGGVAGGAGAFTPSSTITPVVPHRHDGIKSGFVGGAPKLKSNEEFNKLMDGELVINPKQMHNFMSNILPQSMVQSSGSGGINIEKLMDITVSGNLDRSVLPDIEKIAQKVISELNKTMQNRGFNRRADLFQE